MLFSKHIKSLFLTLTFLLFMNCQATPSFEINIDGKLYTINETNMQKNAFQIHFINKNKNSSLETSELILTKYFVYLDNDSFVKKHTSQKYGKIILSKINKDEGDTISYIINNTPNKTLLYSINRYIRKDDFFYSYTYNKKINIKNLSSDQIQKKIATLKQKDMNLTAEISNLPFYGDEISKMHE